MRHSSDDTLTLPRIRDRINFYVLILILVLVPIAAHAGGLAMAPLAAISGVTGILTRGRFLPSRIAYWKIAVAAFLIWAMLTSLWSPYHDDQMIVNSVKLAIGSVLFFAFVSAFHRGLIQNALLLGHIVVAISFLLAGALIADISFGFGLTFFFDPLADGEDFLKRRGDAEMNTGHGITILVLLLPAVLGIISRYAYKMAICTALVVMAFWASSVGQLSVGEFAVIFGLAAAGAAYVWPRWIIGGLTYLAMASILFAPLIGGFAAHFTAAQKAALPFSWEHRLEMWAYVGQKIIEAPWVGHGFDSARTLSQTFDSRGFEGISIVSLHPHNAGLHIWYETGIVGVALAVLTIWMLGRLATRVALRNGRVMASSIAGYMAAAILLCAVTYGVWQDWWWATLIFSAALLQILSKNFEK